MRISQQQKHYNKIKSRKSSLFFTRSFRWNSSNSIRNSADQDSYRDNDMVLSPIHHHMENMVPMNIEPPSESFEIPNIIIPQRNVYEEIDSLESQSSKASTILDDVSFPVFGPEIPPTEEDAYSKFFDWRSMSRQRFQLFMDLGIWDRLIDTLKRYYDSRLKTIKRRNKVVVDTPLLPLSDTNTLLLSRIVDGVLALLIAMKVAYECKGVSRMVDSFGKFIFSTW